MRMTTAFGQSSISISSDGGGKKGKGKGHGKGGKKGGRGSWKGGGD